MRLHVTGIIIAVSLVFTVFSQPTPSSHQITRSGTSKSASIPPPEPGFRKSLTETRSSHPAPIPPFNSQTSQAEAAVNTEALPEHQEQPGQQPPLAGQESNSRAAQTKQEENKKHMAQQQLRDYQQQEKLRAVEAELERIKKELEQTRAQAQKQAPSIETSSAIALEPQSSDKHGEKLTSQSVHPLPQQQAQNSFAPQEPAQPIRSKTPQESSPIENSINREADLQIKQPLSAKSHGLEITPVVNQLPEQTPLPPPLPKHFQEKDLERPSANFIPAVQPSPQNTPDQIMPDPHHPQPTGVQTVAKQPNNQPEVSHQSTKSWPKVTAQHQASPQQPAPDRASDVPTKGSLGLTKEEDEELKRQAEAQVQKYILKMKKKKLEEHLLQARKAEEAQLVASQQKSETKRQDQLITDVLKKEQPQAIGDQLPNQQKVETEKSSSPEDKALEEFREENHKKIKRGPILQSKHPLPQTPHEDSNTQSSESEISPQQTSSKRNPAAIEQPQAQKEPKQNLPLHPEAPAERMHQPVQDKQSPLPKPEHSPTKTIQQEEALQHKTLLPSKQEPQQTRPLHENEVKPSQKEQAGPPPPEPASSEKKENNYHLAFTPQQPPVNFRSREEDTEQTTKEQSPQPSLKQDQHAPAQNSEGQVEQNNNADSERVKATNQQLSAQQQVLHGELDSKIAQEQQVLPKKQSMERQELNAMQKEESIEEKRGSKDAIRQSKEDENDRTKSETMGEKNIPGQGIEKEDGPIEKKEGVLAREHQAQLRQSEEKKEQNIQKKESKQDEGLEQTQKYVNDRIFSPNRPHQETTEKENVGQNVAEFTRDQKEKELSKQQQDEEKLLQGVNENKQGLNPNSEIKKSSQLQVHESSRIDEKQPVKDSKAQESTEWQLKPEGTEKQQPEQHLKVKQEETIQNKPKESKMNSPDESTFASTSHGQVLHHQFKSKQNSIEGVAQQPDGSSVKLSSEQQEDNPFQDSTKPQKTTEWPNSKVQDLQEVEKTSHFSSKASHEAEESPGEKNQEVKQTGKRQEEENKEVKEADLSSTQRQNEVKSNLQDQDEEEASKDSVRENYVHSPTRDNSQAELALVIVALIILLLLVQRCRKGESGMVQQGRREDEEFGLEGGPEVAERYDED